MANEGGDILANMLQDETTFKPEYCGAGWKNKMFVKADLMPHRIRINNNRIERLQDISDADCFRYEAHQEVESGKYKSMWIAYYIDGSLCKRAESTIKDKQL